MHHNTPSSRPRYCKISSVTEKLCNTLKFKITSKFNKPSAIKKKNGNEQHLTKPTARCGFCKISNRPAHQVEL